MKKYKVEFCKCFNYQIEVEAENQQDAEDKAQAEFDNVLNPQEDGQEGYWELVEVEECE